MQECELLYNKIITWCPDFRNDSPNEKFTHTYIMLFNDKVVAQYDENTWLKEKKLTGDNFYFQ